MKGTTMLLISGSEKIPKPVKHRPLTSIIQVCKRSLVGARGFEPPTSCTPCKRASRAAPRPDWQASIIVVIAKSRNTRMQLSDFACCISPCSIL